MSTINVKVLTEFGCLCCNCCRCRVCGKGRKYQIALRTTDMIETIIERLTEQNPKIAEKNVKPSLFFAGELLSLDRRIINYDLIEGSEITAIMPPSTWCIRDFRKPPKDKDGITDDENDEGNEPRPQKQMDEE